jgi:hypothetical protein
MNQQTNRCCLPTCLQFATFSTSHMFQLDGRQGGEGGAARQPPRGVQDVRCRQVLQGGQRREHAWAVVCNDTRVARSDRESQLCQVPWCMSTACWRLHIGQICRRSVPCKAQARENSETWQQMDPCPMSESSRCMPGAVQDHAPRQVLQAEALLQRLLTQQHHTRAATLQQQQPTSPQGSCR